MHCWRASCMQCAWPVLTLVQLCTHYIQHPYGCFCTLVPVLRRLKAQPPKLSHCFEPPTQAEFEKALGPPINPLPSPTKAPPTPEVTTEVLSTDASATMHPLESLNPPVMYSSMTQISDPSSFNGRASWLAGKPVHGNAYLTYTKIRHTGWLVPAVVFNSDFTLEVFWQWVHGLLPEVEYVNRAGSALVSRLPSVFRWVPCSS